MVDIKRTKILDRVKKLLALSTSSNVNEAATAAAAAQKLMLENRLTEADVSDLQEGQMFELSMGAVGFASRWKFVLVTAAGLLVHLAEEKAQEDEGFSLLFFFAQSPGAGNHGTA